jgi:hypothetical protein
MSALVPLREEFVMPMCHPLPRTPAVSVRNIVGKNIVKKEFSNNKVNKE